MPPSISVAAGQSREEPGIETITTGDEWLALEVLSGSYDLVVRGGTSISP